MNLPMWFNIDLSCCSWYFYSLISSISSTLIGRERIIRSTGMLMELSIICLWSIALFRSSSLYFTLLPFRLTRPWSSLTLTNFSLHITKPFLVILKMWTCWHTRQVSCPAASLLLLSVLERALGWIDERRQRSHRQSPQKRTRGKLEGSSNLEEQTAQW